MRNLSMIVVAVIASVILAGCSNNTNDLTGKDWQLTSITEKTPAFLGVVPPDEQSKYTINFNTNGTFNGTADCNAVVGTYTTGGSGKMTITVGAATLVACPDGSFADLFVHALSRAQSYAIADGYLTITLDDGGTLVFIVGTGPAASASAGAVVTAAPTASPTPTPTTLADREPDADTDGQPDADTDRVTHGQADRQAKRRSVRDAEADRHAGPDTQADSSADPEADASPDARADPGTDARARCRSHRQDVAPDGDHRAEPCLPGRDPGG